MSEIEKLRPESKKQKILPPPGPPPTSDSLAEYWQNNRPPFPLEEVQRQNTSVLHRVMTAFVPARRLDESQNRPLLVGPHNLVPIIEVDHYMARPFEERLELELESAGFGLPPGVHHSGGFSAFSSDIKEYEKELAELQPKIQRLQATIVENYPQWQEEEAQRRAQMERYEKFSAQMPPPVKKK
jgi:hypothetical protein